MQSKGASKEKAFISARLTPPLIEVIKKGYVLGYSDAEMVREGLRCFGMRKGLLNEKDSN